MDKDIMLLTGLIIVVGVVSAYSISSAFHLMSMQDSASQPKQQQSAVQRMSMMSLTEFDAGMAEQLMDRNGDGMCDFCGMRIEDCVASGMMQCSMDPNTQIGVLGTQHIHADFKIYLDGRVVDLSDKSHMERMRFSQSVSSFIHVDSASGAEKTGDVLHMHATSVPLWIFFSSIGLELPDVKTYVNGLEIQDYPNYVFNDLDKILINDGVGDMDEQLASITDFAKIH